MNERGIATLGALALLALSGTCLAGEGYLDLDSGEVAVHAGYGPSAAAVYSEDALLVDVNLRVYQPGSSPQWTTLDPYTPEVAGFVDRLLFAMGLWEHAPCSRLQLGLGSFRITPAYSAEDGASVASLMGEPFLPNGLTASYLAHVLEGGRFVPRLTELDVQLDRALMASGSSFATAIATHELGHGLGCNHSWLSSDSTTNLNGATSLPAIMAYGDGRDAVAASGVLGPDDAALVARLYPQHTGVLSPSAIQRLSRSHVSVRGVVTSADCGAELQGANVLLVDPASGRALVSRVSGYADGGPAGARSGAFVLDGVPPGTWDVLVAARDDPAVSTGGPALHYIRVGGTGTSWPIAGDELDAGFPRAWVRGVPVDAGEVVELGEVRAGVDRPVERPDRVTATVRYEGSGSYSHYWFDFWSYVPWQMAHRSGVVTASTYSTELASEWHLVRIYGWTGSAWEEIQPWTWRDYRARRLSVSWSPPVRQLYRPRSLTTWAQAFETTLRLRPSGIGEQETTRTVDGQRFTTWVAPGTYEHELRARWSLDEPPFQVRGWTAVSTQ